MIADAPDAGMLLQFLQPARIIKLYSGPLSMSGAKVEIALCEKGAEFELKMVPSSRTLGCSAFHPEVVRVNPKQQVPVLIDNGLELYDCTQIFEYCEDRWPVPPLWPVTVAERAHARQLEHWSDEVFFPQVIKLMRLRTIPEPEDSPDWILARESIEAFYSQVDRRLASRQYLADTYSYADIAFYMAQFFASLHRAPVGVQHVHLLAWRKRLAARQAVRLVIERIAEYVRRIGDPVPPYD
jgi:glutathione S-transferase